MGHAYNASSSEDAFQGRHEVDLEGTIEGTIEGNRIVVRLVHLSTRATSIDVIAFGTLTLMAIFST